MVCASFRAFPFAAATSEIIKTSIFGLQFLPTSLEHIVLPTERAEPTTWVILSDRLFEAAQLHPFSYLRRQQITERKSRRKADKTHFITLKFFRSCPLLRSMPWSASVWRVFLFSAKMQTRLKYSVHVSCSLLLINVPIREWGCAFAVVRQSQTASIWKRNLRILKMLRNLCCRCFENPAKSCEEIKASNDFRFTRPQILSSSRQICL